MRWFKRLPLWLSGATVVALMSTAFSVAPPNAPASPNLTSEPRETRPVKPSQPSASAAGRYDLGNYTVTDLYLSPDGNDDHSGASRSAPLRTLTAAWNKIPSGVLATGYRLNLLPGASGVYPCEPGPEDSNCINYFSDRHGTYQYPLIIRALDGPGTVTLRGGLNLANIDYLYLLDLNLVGGGALPTNGSGNNLLHLERGKHVLFRGLSVLGPACASDACNNLQEVLKINQSQYLYVEDSLIGGAWHSTVDYFVVQHGHFLNNRLHTAGQWCMYIKGGSAYLQIEGNEFYGCQLGFQAGQSANLAMMLSPWLHYEIYDIKFINNLLHDIPGVGFSAAGAYNLLFAYNTLYRVGTSAEPGYALAEFVYGERNCTPTDDLPNPVPSCAAFTDQGAWGPNFQTDSQPAIPNRNVYVYNNILYNPPLSQTLYSHFNVFGPLARPAGFQNSPNPANADDNLAIRGNLIWNGPADHPLGVEEAAQGCQPANATCHAAQLRADNTINTLQPQLDGNFRPVAGSNIFSATTYAIPDFTWGAFTPGVPSGTLTNTVPYDRAGNARLASGPPGAYAAPAARYRLCLPLVLR